MQTKVEFIFDYDDDTRTIQFCPRVSFDYQGPFLKIKGKMYGTDDCEDYSIVSDKSNPSKLYLQDLCLNDTLSCGAFDYEGTMGINPIVDLEYTFKPADYLDELQKGIDEFNGKFNDKYYLFVDNDKIYFESKE